MGCILDVFPMCCVLRDIREALLVVIDPGPMFGCFIPDYFLGSAIVGGRAAGCECIERTSWQGCE